MRTISIAAILGSASAVCSPCYEKPPACTGSETSIQITGVTGDFCSPLCYQNQCPKGDGSFTATPSCVLETQGSSKPTQCALICTPGDDAACPAGASCQSIQGEGICTYPAGSLGATAKIVTTLESSSGLVQTEALIARVNNDATSTWTAGINDRFVGVSIATMREGLNARADGVAAIPPVVHTIEEINATPDAYDPRNDTARMHCTGPVLDQGFCGSCWAFGATEAVSDRVCIAKGNSSAGAYIGLAPLDLTSCDDGIFKGENGCQGGQLAGAWNYAKKVRLPWHVTCATSSVTFTSTHTSHLPSHSRTHISCCATPPPPHRAYFRLASSRRAATRTSRARAAPSRRAPPTRSRASRSRSSSRPRSAPRRRRA